MRKQKEKYATKSIKRHSACRYQARTGQLGPPTPDRRSRGQSKRLGCQLTEPGHSTLAKRSSAKCPETSLHAAMGSKSTSCPLIRRRCDHMCGEIAGAMRRLQLFRRRLIPCLGCTNSFHRAALLWLDRSEVRGRNVVDRPQIRQPPIR
jgi:hypothetical protein